MLTRANFNSESRHASFNALMSFVNHMLPVGRRSIHLNPWTSESKQRCFDVPITCLSMQYGLTRPISL